MVLKFEKVSYEDKIKDVSYEFTEGKITSIIGASGSGKKIIGLIMSGLIENYTGKVTNSYIGRSLGYVFAPTVSSFIYNTVRKEITFGLEKYHYKLNTLNKRTEDALKVVGLSSKYLDRNPFELSSGEKECIALATVLALNPKLLIINNPTHSLDNKMEDKFVRLLKRLKNNYHKTIIIITDDVGFALKVSDNYLLMKKGKVVSKGTSKELLTCDKLRTSGLNIPEIIEFINTVQKRKGVSLEPTYDIKELMKDIYRNVK